MPWRSPRQGGARRRRRRWRWPIATTSRRLTEIAERLCLAGHGTRVSFSQEGVHPADEAVPRRLPLLHVRACAARRRAAYLSPEAVLDIARAGKAAGCKEALFTLGDQPELRYAAARDALAELGSDSTLDYLERSRRAGAEGDRAAAASQSRRDGRGMARPPAQGLGLAGHHAGDGLRPAVAARRPALRLARQGAGACASPRWRPPAARACRSPPAS